MPNMEKVMDYVANNLQVCVNGLNEEKITNNDNRYSKYNYICSSDWNPGEPKDMIQMTVRFTDKFFTGWDEYCNFPFDTL